MNQPVSIVSTASVSALGFHPDAIWENRKRAGHLFRYHDFGQFKAWGGFLPDDLRAEIEQLKQSDSKYKNLDDTVLMAVFASRKAAADAGWKKGDTFGINMGSSRGATALFEKHHAEFLETGKAPLLTSPVTTLGNISSWIAQDLGSGGPEISHSITCSTSLHALLNGYAWLRSGLSDKFLIGGSESPLTAFTVAQMQSLKIYSREPEGSEFPSRASDPEKTHSSMILGEAASVIALESGISERTLAVVESIGYATEELIHGTSISAEAECLQKSMKMAIGNLDPTEIDAIVLHAPGTVKGDASERKAIENIFGNHQPLLTTTKWKNGHTFGASGAVNVELAVEMIRRQEFIGTPFLDQHQNAKIRRVLVNAVGFGGNAVSAVISHLSVI